MDWSRSRCHRLRSSCSYFDHVHVFSALPARPQPHSQPSADQGSIKENLSHSQHKYVMCLVRSDPGQTATTTTKRVTLLLCRSTKHRDDTGTRRALECKGPKFRGNNYSFRFVYSLFWGRATPGREGEVRMGRGVVDKTKTHTHARTHFNGDPEHRIERLLECGQVRWFPFCFFSEPKSIKSSTPPTTRPRPCS